MHVLRPVGHAHEQPAVHREATPLEILQTTNQQNSPHIRSFRHHDVHPQWPVEHGFLVERIHLDTTFRSHLFSLPRDLEDRDPNRSYLVFEHRRALIHLHELSHAAPLSQEARRAFPSVSFENVYVRP